VAGSCEHGNEPSSSIRRGGISRPVERLIASEEDILNNTRVENSGLV
jgi:hypothetical protein